MKIQPLSHWNRGDCWTYGNIWLPEKESEAKEKTEDMRQTLGNVYIRQRDGAVAEVLESPDTVRPQV